MRLRSFTTETRTAGVWGNPVTKVNHYDGSSDSPKWIAQGSAWTRYVEAPDGDFAISTTDQGVKTLNAANLHGDVVFTLNLATPNAAPNAYFDSDEFGNPTTGNAGRYGWLGGKQRSAEALGGVILMGVRLYSPSLGRFLSVDPVDGGSANAYDYCYADGVNCTDLDGKWSWKRVLGRVAVVASFAAIIPGPIGAAASLVSAGAYAATGNYKQAALMAGGALLAMAGLGAAVVVYRAHRVVQAAKAAHLGNGIRSGMKATRATSYVAGRMWAGRGAVKSFAQNGAKMWSKGKATYRAPSPKPKGKFGFSSNLTYSERGRHDYFNFHINHSKPKRWAPWW